VTATDEKPVRRLSARSTLWLVCEAGYRSTIPHTLRPDQLQGARTYAYCLGRTALECNYAYRIDGAGPDRAQIKDFHVQRAKSASRIRTVMPAKRAKLVRRGAAPTFRAARARSATGSTLPAPSIRIRRPVTAGTTRVETSHADALWTLQATAYDGRAAVTRSPKASSRLRNTMHGADLVNSWRTSASRRHQRKVIRHRRAVRVPSVFVFTYLLKKK